MTAAIDLAFEATVDRGRADFAIDAENLVRVPPLRAADEAFLDRGGPRRIDQQPLHVDAGVGPAGRAAAAIAVIADDADASDFRREPAQHVANVGGAAGPGFALRRPAAR